MNFCIPPEKLEYAAYLLPFELLMRDLKSENLSQEDFKRAKARLQDTALLSYNNCNSNPKPKNLSKNEVAALKTLQQQK